MINKPLDQWSKEELIVELQTLMEATRRVAATDDADRERLVHDLHVHQIELEMQNRELRDTQSRLEEATVRYADLYDFAPVGYCTLTPEGTIRDINLRGAAFFRSTREALLGKSFPSIAALKDRRPFEEHFKRCKNEKGQVTSEATFLLGTRGARTVQLISEPMLDASGSMTAYRTILVDVTDLKELESKLRLLADAGQALSTSLDYAATLNIVVGVAVPTLADLCIVDILGEEHGTPQRLVAFADARKQAMLAERLKEVRPRPDWQTTPVRVFRSGEPLLFPELTDEVREEMSHDKRHADALAGAGIQSLMVVPLAARGHTFGVVSLAAAESGHRYSHADLRLAQDLANRAAMAIDNARLYALAQQEIAARQEILARLISVQEEERRRISRDLHDHLGQQLTALRLKVESVLSSVESGSEAARRVEAAQALITGLDAELDFLIWELRPDVLTDLGVVVALRNFVGEWSTNYGIPAEFHSTCVDHERFGSEVETNLYRIAQEALNNVHKHADATRVSVVVERRGDELVLIVEDDGRGFRDIDANERGLRQRGFGLVGMQERAALLGGRLEMRSAPGKGTSLSVQLPVSPPTEQRT